MSNWVNSSGWFPLSCSSKQFEYAVPVDVFSSAQLAQTGQTNLMQMLNFTAPSLNASMQIMTEPVTLRGLDPDHTLILLNGTRYHNIAYMNPGAPKGSVGQRFSWQ